MAQEARALTPAQCKEARRLLGWTQSALARKLGIYQGHISAFEITGNLSRTIYGRRDRLSHLRAVFEMAGIEFVDDNDGGAGVRLRRAEP